MLKQLTIENFRSYERASVEFGTGKLNVVIGDSLSDYSDSNGSGKSTLMYAVCWALFGTWPGMDKADSAVRQPIGKDCMVSVTFNVHGRDYRIVRTRSHSKYNSSIFIDQHTGDMKIMQDKIQQLVGMDYETFISTMMFTGHPDAAFADMTDNDQKKILRALLPVDLGEATEKSKQALDNARRALADEQNRIDYQDRTIAQSELRIKQQKAVIEEMEKKISWETSNQSAKIEEIDKQRNKIMEENIELRDKLGTVRRKYDDLVKLGPQWEASAKAWDASADRASKQAHLQTQISTLERTLDTRRTELHRRIADIHEHAKAARSSQVKVCPACGSAISNPEHLAKHYEDQAAKENNAGMISLSNLENDIDRLRKEVAASGVPEGFDAQYKDFKAQYQNFLADMRQSNAEADKLRTRLEEIDRYLMDSERQVTALRNQVQDRTRETDSAKAVLAQMEKDEAQAKLDKENMAGRLAEKTRELGLAENIALLFSSGKGSLRHFIFESALPELSATAQMFLRFLSDSQLNVSLKSHKESGKKVIEGFFVEAVKEGSTGSYGDLSGGEKRRIDLAIFLALNLIANRNVFPLKTIFLDEIADPLDETGQQKVVQLLSHVCAEYGINCMLLTNVKELVASTPSGYRCVMRDGISQLTAFTES